MPYWVGYCLKWWAFTWTAGKSVSCMLLSLFGKTELLNLPHTHLPLSQGDPVWALCFIVLILELFATWMMMFFCDCSVFLHKEVLRLSTLRWHASVAEMDCSSGNTRSLTCFYCCNPYKSFKKQHLSWEKPFQCHVTLCIIIFSHVTKGDMAFLFPHGPQILLAALNCFN